MHITDVETRADDGSILRARFVKPHGQVHGLIVAGHAMMVDGRTLLADRRPCLARTLSEHGFLVLVPDLRGHGRSGPGAEQGGHWTYDDLVADTGAWLTLAESLAAGLPIAWLGHSLFGHVSLAWFGQHPQRAPVAYVAIAVNVWARRFETNPLIWTVQRTVMATAAQVVRIRGFMPARALRMGSADEAADYWLDMARFARTNAWTARDGTDYLANLQHIPSALLCVVSDGDGLYTRPAAGIAFASSVPNHTVLCLGDACVVKELRGLQPDHMGLCTDRRSEPLWRWLAEWLLGATPIG
jgi:predicted alpha/beta hydrolase